MSNSLVDLLLKCGESRVIEELKGAVEGGKVELIHTGAYHPIFPLLPEDEIRRQIELDAEFKAIHFGLTARTGILSPELCYDDQLLPVFRNLGFRWTVIDDRVMEMNGVAVPDSAIWRVADFAVFMRSSFWSDRIRRADVGGRHLTGRQFVDDLRREALSKDRDCYKIICLSAETFGHHVSFYEETFLRDMLFALEECGDVRLCQVSDLLKTTSLGGEEKQRENSRTFEYFPPSSWATQPEDYGRGDFYPHWKSSGNRIHERLWSLTQTILDSCRSIDFDNGANHELRSLLDRGFYSTQYYWASVWFWTPELIYVGIDQQMRALYKCVELTGNRRLLKEGGRIYADLMWEIYKEHEEHLRRQRRPHD
jgi:hypothetical protein